MGEIAAAVVRWTIRIGTVFFLVLAFVLVYNLFESTIAVSINNSVLAELMAMVQIWLPFNLGQIFNFLMTATSLILMYYLYRIAINMINKLVS